MSLTSFSASIIRRCPLGRIVASHDVNGPDEHQVRAYAEVLEQMKNGETLELALTRNMPDDHALAGVDLQQLAGDAPAADRQPWDGTLETTLVGLAAYARRVLEGTDGLWPPAARATECRRALENIEAECRRAHAAATTEEGAER